MSETGIAYVRTRLRKAPDVHTYEAVSAEHLAARLADSDDEHVVEDCNVVLPIPSLNEIKAAWEVTDHVGPGVIGTVMGGVWTTGPLVGHDQPRGFDWYG